MDAGRHFVSASGEERGLVCSLQSFGAGFDSVAHSRDKLARSTDRKGTSGSLTCWNPPQKFPVGSGLVRGGHGDVSHVIVENHVHESERKLHSRKGMESEKKVSCSLRARK